MPPKIDAEKCNMCNICVENCPGDVFGIDPESAELRVARSVFCWHCGTCEVDCPTTAITVELPIMIVG